MNILFLCTGNSCRSQMAEGIATKLKSSIGSFRSAGIVAKGIDPKAVQVLEEINIDISKQISKTLESVEHINFDFVITLCGHANETCPIFPRQTKKIHVGFSDPPELAKGAESEEEALSYYRRVRDEIKDFILNLENILKIEN